MPVPVILTNLAYLFLSVLEVDLRNVKVLHESRANWFSKQLIADCGCT